MKNTIHFTISFDLVEKPTDYQGFKIVEHNQQSLVAAGNLKLTALLDNTGEAMKIASAKV